MGFAPTWLRQVSPSASQNHFNHWLPQTDRASAIVLYPVEISSHLFSITMQNLVVVLILHARK